MYSTCVSEWRVPLMNVTEVRIGQSPWRADDLVGAEAVLHRHHGRAREVAGEARGDRLEVGALAADEHELRLGQRGRVGRGDDAAVQVGAARDADALVVQRAGVLLAPGEHRHLRDLGEVAREEAADHAGPGDADPLGQRAPWWTSATNSASSTSPRLRMPSSLTSVSRSA